MHDAMAAQKPWVVQRGLSYLCNAHRLDAEASGVILLAKNKPALVTLADSFGSDKPVRKFVALVRGQPPSQSFETTQKLALHPMRPGFMRVDSRGGKRSRTQFEVFESFKGYALLTCLALTNRMHQVRVHAQHMGLPIVGDEHYGGKPLWLSALKRDYRLKPGREERPLISRAALHAEQLTLPHPVTGETLTFNAPWPKELKVAVKYLREYAAGVAPS
jgi:RluA family pseudouridine synthase